MSVSLPFRFLLAPMLVLLAAALPAQANDGVAAPTSHPKAALTLPGYMPMPSPEGAHPIHQSGVLGKRVS
ncbi:hypothetical protein [Mesorhizobium carmichaelinearum]|uniref:hypothetical protein n=1 Tax=Mesorhizobium carmichaelinearum TaxID=1208188 RepID=UPI00117E26EE|nr:hypothetical protein [Mesorhizobium carmichaelinearum]